MVVGCTARTKLAAAPMDKYMAPMLSTSQGDDNVFGELINKDAFNELGSFGGAELMLFAPGAPGVSGRPVLSITRTQRGVRY